MKHIYLLTSLALSCAWSIMAQGTLEDYNRAYGLGKKYDFGHVDNARPDVHWIDGTHRFWYVDEHDGTRQYTVVDADRLKKSALFDHKALAGSLISQQQDSSVNAETLRLERLQVAAGGDTVRFIYKGQHWMLTEPGRRQRLQSMGPVTPPAPQPHWMVVDEEKTGSPAVSPDGSRECFIRDNNVVLRDLRTRSERRLTTDGTIGNYYSANIYWSPDGAKIALNRIRPVEKRYVHYVESSPAPGAQPVLHTQEYAKPGDELRFKQPCIIDVETGDILAPDTQLFDRQYDLYGPQWNDDSRGITFEYNERGHKVYRVLEMSAVDGSVRPLVEERHDKYVNYSRIFRHMLSDGSHIIWSSERDNYNHLYLYDRATGKPVNQITRGPWYVRDVIDIDEPNRRIYFVANGVNAEEDPYFKRYFSVNFDGTAMTDMTPAPGTHKATLSADRKYIVDTYSSIDTPPVTVLRDATTGKELMEICRADIGKLKAAGWTAPEVFTAPGRDGVTPMWGLIYRPSNFDPSRKYPVIEYIYQGPGDQYVPKAFTPYSQHLQPLAELGFVVVMVDGMGTSFRSREFENVCYKNLLDAGLPDHIAWIKAAGKKYPYLDLERVGIFGASAGGQESTTAVLHHPEFYKAAYSSCGCHDNRMDKIWWNEQWLGYPIDESYVKASNVDNAHKLTRPLMLVVGELDDNVDPASTMQVVDALIKANKDFELVVLPGVRHTLGESYGEHKRYDFFVRNLLGVTPPSWNEVASH